MTYSFGEMQAWSPKKNKLLRSLEIHYAFLSAGKFYFIDTKETILIYSVHVHVRYNLYIDIRNLHKSKGV